MLIMVIVGLTIIIFLIILYCLQQRGRNQTHSLSVESHTDQNSSAEGDNLSLYQPPPPYEEVMSSSIYPNTRVIHQRMNSFTINVPPPTPPPNYDAALNILARSQEFESMKPTPIPSGPQKQPSLRRCHSEEILTPHLLPDASSIFTFTQIPQMNENR